VNSGPNSFANMKLSLEEKIDKYLNPNASVFSPNNSEKLLLCLRSDAEKVKMLSEHDAKARDTAIKAPSNLGEMARKLREQLERDKKPELNNPVGRFCPPAADEASIFDSIKNNATVGKTPIMESSVSRSCDLGVQTNVSSLDLDDPMTLKQTKIALIAELQENKDKLYKIQNEGKVEREEMVDKVRVLNEETNKLKVENACLKETIQKVTSNCKDASKKEEELKQTKESLDLECEKSSMIQDELSNTKLRLENEQRLSSQLQSQLQGSREQEGLLKTLKLQCLKTEFGTAKSFLMGKKVENEKFISYLAIMNNSEVRQGSNIIKSNIEKLNEFSARLYRAIADLQEKYEENVRQIESSHGLEVTDLNFDTGSFDSPQLTSVDLDTLRLLTSIKPEDAPFANYPITTRPLPSRPPGLLRPPPGLPPMAESLNTLRDNLDSMRAATIVGPGAAFFPRPDPVTTRPTDSTATAHTRPVATVTATARPGVTESSRAAQGGKNKSYTRLLAQLQDKYPELSTEDAARYIHKLRNENNGKLSGMSIQSIKEKVGLFIRGDMQRVRTESDTDNNCSICLEDMTDMDSRSLKPCMHTFHNMCINNWLASPGGAGNTCPMCRHYIVQESEFPDLGYIRCKRHKIGKKMCKNSFDL